MPSKANTGGIQPWSVGSDYPYSIVGIGYNPVRWKAVNLHHDINSPEYVERDTYAEANADIAVLRQREADALVARLGKPIVERRRPSRKALEQYTITNVGTFQWVLRDVRSGSITVHRSRSEAVLALFGAGVRNLVNS